MTMPNGLHMGNQSGCQSVRPLTFGSITMFVSCDLPYAHDGLHQSSLEYPNGFYWEIRWRDETPS